MDYKPTYSARCEDEDCASYGKPLVDRGYGYPICPSQKWYSERFPGSKNIPMAARYLAVPELGDDEYFCEKCEQVFNYTYLDQCNCECCGTYIQDGNVAEVNGGGRQ